VKWADLQTATNDLVGVGELEPSPFSGELERGLRPWTARHFKFEF
jgi:hypothetical protein